MRLAPQLGLADRDISATFAAKGNQFLLFAITAYHTHKTMFEATTTQKIIKLSLDVLW